MLIMSPKLFFPVYGLSNLKMTLSKAMFIWKAKDNYQIINSKNSQ